MKASSTDKIFIYKTIPLEWDVHIHWFASVKGLVKLSGEGKGCDIIINTYLIGQTKDFRKISAVFIANSCLLSDLHSV